MWLDIADAALVYAFLQSHKWLLVNIQDHDNFRSHSLNRDVWGDETIQCLIQVCVQNLPCVNHV